MYHQTSAAPPPVMTVKEAEDASRLSHTTIYSLMNSGRLRSTKVGRRRLILRESLMALLTGDAA